MTVLLTFLVAVALGAAKPRRWLLLAPTLIGSLALIILAIGGHRLTDTPIPFLIVLTTLAIVLGGFLRTARRADSGAASGG
jgi:hypothetical protein